MPKLLSVWELPYPVSTNRYWRKTNTGKVYKSKEAAEYKKAAVSVAKHVDINNPHSPHACDIELHVDIFPKQNKDGTESKKLLDIDNCLKVALDALEGLAYIDDKQVRRLIVNYGAAKIDGGLLILAYELNK